jgi:hypothetical protein
MGVGSVLTGLAIYKPAQFSWLTGLLGGYKAARLEHFILTVGYVLFFFIHVGQVIRAGLQNFQSMVTGFEFIKRTGPPVAPESPGMPGPVNDRPIAPSPTPNPLPA